jgi:hypothetical protein
MDETKWVCERCQKEYDLENGEGWITLVDDEYFAQDGKITPLEPYECVCYECADELLAIVEKCNKECWHCEATLIWGLSIMDCLRFQLKFDVLEFPPKPKIPRGSLEEAKEILKIFDRF